MEKYVDGEFAQRFLYQDDLKIFAELNQDGSIKSEFVYYNNTNVPEFMNKINRSTNIVTTFRIITNHLGSVQMVVNANTEEIAQQMQYDEFGNVTLDTNPGFQPFGFAGGIYDRDTGFTRFGARDYDPVTGRWTSKDPIGFEGGDTSLYSYSIQNPTNFIDSDGLNPFAGIYGGFVGGTVVCGPVCGAIGAVVGGIIAGATLSELINIYNSQDKKLTDGEIKELKKHGIDPHDIKKQLGKSKSDLFKRPGGEICVKPKNGSGPGEDTGYNIKDILGIK